MGGKHNHKSADAEENIHAKGAAVQKADMLQQDKQGRNSPQGLDAVKMEFMKIGLVIFHEMPHFCILAVSSELIRRRRASFFCPKAL